VCSLPYERIGLPNIRTQIIYSRAVSPRSSLARFRRARHVCRTVPPRATKLSDSIQNELPPADRPRSISQHPTRAKEQQTPQRRRFVSLSAAGPAGRRYGSLLMGSPASRSGKAFRWPLHAPRPSSWVPASDTSTQNTRCAFPRAPYRVPIVLRRANERASQLDALGSSSLQPRRESATGLRLHSLRRNAREARL
jgi:hypothetical protein